METAFTVAAKEAKEQDRSTRHNDEYAKSMERQHSGLPCWHCNSLWGHYGHCALINGGTKYTTEQSATLKVMGLKENEGWSFRAENKGLPSRHVTWQEHCIYNHKEM